MPTSGATLEQKNGVLELTKLEYHKKWYFPIYFPNSVLGLNISKINANGPFCPFNSMAQCPGEIWSSKSYTSPGFVHKPWKKNSKRLIRLSFIEYAIRTGPRFQHLVLSTGPEAGLTRLRPALNPGRLAKWTGLFASNGLFILQMCGCDWSPQCSSKDKFKFELDRNWHLVDCN